MMTKVSSERKKEWRKPVLEVVEIKDTQTSGSDDKWEFTPHDGFWKRQKLMLGS